MNESTQMGDSTELNDAGDIAAMIKANRTQPVEAPAEPVETEVETVSEETDAVEAEGESEALETDATESEEETFERLTELAEATGMDFDEFLSNIKATVKVKGEESEQPLSEIIKGYQLQSDYTKKNEAFLAQQKEWEEQRSKAQAELQQHFQRTGHAFKMAQDQLTQDFQGIDWKSLEKEDPEQYLLQRQKFGERQAQIDQAINQATQHAQAVMQRQQAEQAQRMEQYTQQQDELLLKALPKWKDSSVRKAESEKVAQFLSDSGYTPEEIGNIRDHRVILMAVNAMQGRETAESADIASKKVKKAPKLVKPGARQSANQHKQAKIKKLKDRLKRTGSVDDVAALLKARRS